MMRLTTSMLFALAVSGAAVAAQQPAIQNGQVESRSTASIDQAIASVGASVDPVWMGWRVPIVAGEHGGCNTWIDDAVYARGLLLDDAVNGAPGPSRPQFAPPAGPVALESGTGLVVLARVAGGRAERLHVIADDCPIDAGGRRVVWLGAVTPAESLRWLDGLTRPDAGAALTPNARRNLAATALSAIALHRDAGADAILDRIAANDDDASLRQQAQDALGTLRGAHGFATLRALLASTQAPDTRRQLVTALGQTRERETVEALRPFLKDADPKVRAAAVYAFAARGGPAVVPDVRQVIDADPDASVRTRAVSGLARLPADTSVPLLIELAGHKDAGVRKEAVTLLGRSDDPRARTFLQSLLK